MNRVPRGIGLYQQPCNNASSGLRSTWLNQLRDFNTIMLVFVFSILRLSGHSGCAFCMK